MAYTIQSTDGTITIAIGDGQLNSDYAIDFIGRNFPNYGAVIAQNELQSLENFANNTPPSGVTPLSGQLWYDTGNDNLRVYDAKGSWQPTRPLIVANGTPLNTFGQNVAGTLSYDQQSQQLRIYDGLTYTLAGLPSGEYTNRYATNTAMALPDRIGARTKTIFFKDAASDIYRPVTAVIHKDSSTAPGYPAGEKIVALLNGGPQFNVDASTSVYSEGSNVDYRTQLSETGGIGTVVYPGMTFRDDNRTFVWASEFAESAFGLNLGDDIFNPGTIIPAANVFYNTADSIPAAPDMYDLGNITNMFNEAYITNIVLGNGTEGSLIPNGNSVITLGSNTNAIDNIFVNDITISGNIITLPGANLGDANSFLGNAYIDTIFANVVNIDGYTMPTTAGSTGDQIYLDANASAFWAEPVNNIQTILAGNGLIKTTTIGSSIGPTDEVPRELITLDVALGSGFEFDGNGNIIIDLAGITTDSINEGSTNLYFTTTRARNSIVPGSGILYGGAATGVVSLDESYTRGLFSAPGDGLDYNATTGAFTIDILGSDFANFVTRSGSQTISGQKTFTSRQLMNSGIRTNSITHTSDLSIAGAATVTIAQATGTITSPGDISGLSDQRLKENLEPIEKALDKIDSLTGYVYDRIDTGQRQAGLLAQDVEQVLPEVIGKTADDYLTLAYGNMMSLIVQGIKELRAEVNELKKKTD